MRFPIKLFTYWLSTMYMLATEDAVQNISTKYTILIYFLENSRNFLRINEEILVIIPELL